MPILRDEHSAKNEESSLIEQSLIELENQFHELNDQLGNLTNKLKPFINPNKEKIEVEPNTKEPYEEKSPFRDKILEIKTQIINTRKEITTILDNIEI